MSVLDRTYSDIKTMKVRGALDIAVAAVKALGSVLDEDSKDTRDLVRMLSAGGKKIKSSRPTAVSLPNAVNYILYVSEKNKHLSREEYRDVMRMCINSFVREQKEALAKIGEFGSNLIEDGDVLMTHCNSDTVVSIFRKAHSEGKKIKVVCTESRPRYQGHLTAKAVSSMGIPTTMIVDSAVHLMMKKLKVDKVFVGADTVCANGDLINKIGTSQVALCAKELNVEFIVATESIKFSPQSLLGAIIQIEERDSSEVIEKRKLPKVLIRNPSFDVTDADLIDMIVTECGVMPPQGAYHLLKEKFGWSLPV
jgi:ribose 1,5-bisphosphate isomerase